MATDFFERQDAARRSTKFLVVMFALGVLGIVGTTMAVAWAAVRETRPPITAEAPPGYAAGAAGSGELSEEVAFPLTAGVGALLLIGGGSLFKVAQLRGGGHVVAENLGGRRVFPDTTDPVERRVLNVVEEMALASGVPVPPVFLLSDEEGINAFAAGYSPSDAVVAVTRGTAEQLSRDELQGVIAHEFSHILNGDMRLSIRLIGVLHGILLIGLIGRILLRLASNSRGVRSSRSKGGNAALYMALIGLALLILGYLGTLIGNLIKAAVSRQREFLADASAVQFTRNPTGLAGALKRIGAAVVGSRLKAANASEASHMYFAEGVWEGITGLTATHPPLKERIRRLDPQWDGTFAVEPLTPAQFSKGTKLAAGLVGAEATTEAEPETVPLRVVAHAADQVGDPTEQHRRYAAMLVQSLPEAVQQSVREPYGARAVLFGLLLDRDPEIRENQLSTLRELATSDVFELTQKLMPELDALDVRARLPLVDLALPALRAMSPSQYRDFLNCFKKLVAADDRLGLFEWTLYRVVLRHLRPQFEKTAAPRLVRQGLERTGPQCSTLLSTLAHADNRRAEAPAAFARGATKLPGVSVQLLDPAECGLDPLSRALDDLARVADKKRRHIVDACAACICADREVTVAEAELLRGVCDMLDCPMPPLLPGGPAAVPDGAVA
jgi:Zn-dependent protease with chaperone function